MLTKSEKLKPVPGVTGLKAEEKKPGVESIEEGRGVFFVGGVERPKGVEEGLSPRTAGEGDAAR